MGLGGGALAGHANAAFLTPITDVIVVPRPIESVFQAGKLLVNPQVTTQGSLVEVDEHFISERFRNDGLCDGGSALGSFESSAEHPVPYRQLVLDL